jgi:hypothetical protein
MLRLHRNWCIHTTLSFFRTLKHNMGSLNWNVLPQADAKTDEERLRLQKWKSEFNKKIKNFQPCGCTGMNCKNAG